MKNYFESKINIHLVVLIDTVLIFVLLFLVSAATSVVVDLAIYLLVSYLILWVVSIILKCKIMFWKAFNFEIIKNKMVWLMTGCIFPFINYFIWKSLLRQLLISENIVDSEILKIKSLSKIAFILLFIFLIVSQILTIAFNYLASYQAFLNYESNVIYSNLFYWLQLLPGAIFIVLFIVILFKINNNSSDKPYKISFFEMMIVGIANPIGLIIQMVFILKNYNFSNKSSSKNRKIQNGEGCITE